MHIAIILCKCQSIVENESRDHNILRVSVVIIGRNKRLKSVAVDEDVLL